MTVDDASLSIFLWKSQCTRQLVDLIESYPMFLRNWSKDEIMHDFSKEIMRVENIDESFSITDHRSTHFLNESDKK